MLITNLYEIKIKLHMYLVGLKELTVFHLIMLPGECSMV